jgi:crotonobetainyl-CoA:carnitine CoA-transferase CaiB-like acyl-CoA transferase
LSIEDEEDRLKLDNLLSDADVLLQSYRPGSLTKMGLSPERLVARPKNGIVCANLSAYDPDSPWADRRGFESYADVLGYERLRG